MEDEDEGFGRARRDDPETAHEAARHNRVPLRMLVLRVYRDAGEHGCTMDEVFERLQGQWPASIVVLITQPVTDPPGRVPLLRRRGSDPPPTSRRSTR